MNAVFLDTVGVLALLDVRDQWHAAAEAAWSRLSENATSFLTTSLVLVECANAAARRPYRAAVVELRGSLMANGEVIERTSEEWNWRGKTTREAMPPTRAWWTICRFW